MERDNEIKIQAKSYMLNSNYFQSKVEGDLDMMSTLIEAYMAGAMWADKNPADPFTKPSARSFFNNVCLMRANQRSFFALARKKDLTDEEREQKQQYLRNSGYFEGIVDGIIDKAQQAIQRTEGAQQ